MGVGQTTGVSGPEGTPVNDGQTARELALALLRETETCTLATVTPEGTPEAATVRFVADDEYTIYLTSSHG